MMNDILNPYIAGAPVVETSMFFGREDVFNWIERSLAGKFVNHILVVHGQRRVGKTSVLKQLPNHLPSKYLQVFFDLQGRTGTKLDRFLWWLASEIVRTLNKEKNLNLPKPEQKAFEDTEYLINDFLPRLRPMLGNDVLLLTFDEFDSLDRAEIQDTLARPLIGYLRRLIELDGLNFIFSIGSSGHKLENMQASYTDFFKSALYRKISFLTHEDCLGLITKPVAGVIQYEQDAIESIIKITSGHPYFTQLMCHELFSRCQKTGARVISSGDVDAILNDVIERGTVNLKFVWDEASDLEKWILAALAQEGATSTQQLIQTLKSQRVRFSETDLNSAVMHLREKDVLTADNRFIIYLLRLWLLANRPMERVREELVQLNPIADRYLEIGDEYRDRGQPQQAIESYQQALSAHPVNIRALNSMAAIQLEQKHFQQAADSYAKTLKIDDENVVARNGYCHANLALGEAAFASGDLQQAIASFQAILNLNPVHIDARQSLATLYAQQAEIQLKTGQEEQALASLQQAIETMPEDETLTARYEQILMQKKAMQVQNLLDKVERALARQRWDEAASYVEKALQVDPENPKLQQRLLEIKDTPRQAKVKTYKLEAEQAIAKGNWTRAMSAIENAMLLAPDDKSLSDWLEGIRSDQSNAQLKLLQSQAEQAEAAGDWDTALAARQAAIKFNPQDKNLARSLAETQKTAYLVRLNSFQSSYEAAVQGSNWDEAAQTAQQAIQYAPDELIWKDRLSAAQSARCLSQLESYLEQAKVARASHNGDAAIAAFEAYLDLEPGDEKVKAELESLRIENLETEFSGLRTRAEAAARAESWEEAIQAWEAALKLKPDQAANLNPKITQARKLSSLAGEYENAQDLMRKRQFSKAIPLLQGILSQDPTYKATSRLLVEAVEANKQRKPFWKQPWLYAGLTGMALMILTLIFQSQIKGLISSPNDKTPGEKLGAHESSPTITSVPTNLATPVPTNPAHQSAKAFADPFFAYIDNTEPDFQEDFSVEQAYWQDLGFEGGSSFLVDEEKMQINGGKIDYSHNQLDASNFVIQYDFSPVNSDNDSFTSINLLGYGLNFEYYYGFNLYFDGMWETSYPEPPHSNPEQGWVTDWSQHLNDHDGTVTVRAIVQDDQVAIYINELPLVYQENVGFSSDVNVQIVFFAPSETDLVATFDNVKFWNLDLVDINKPEASAFIKPILAYIGNNPPTFENDFSTPNPEWLIGIEQENINPVDDFVVDGTLNINNSNSNLNSHMITFPSDLLVAKDSVISFVVDPAEFNLPASFGFGLKISDQYPFITINFEPHENRYWIIRELQNLPSLDEGYIDLSTRHEVQIMTYHQTLTILLDGELLIMVEFEEEYAGDINHFFIIKNDNADIQDLTWQISFDDIRFWNLDGVEILAQEETASETTLTPVPTSTASSSNPSPFYEPIVAYINQTSPTFEDDFSSEKWEWGGDTEGVIIPVQAVNGELRIGDSWNTAKKDFRESEYFPDINVPGVSFPRNGLFDAYNFALHFGFWFDDLNSISLKFRSMRGKETGYQFEISSSGLWQLKHSEDGIVIIQDMASLIGEMEMLLVIARDNHIVIFLNGSLIYEGNNLESLNSSNKIFVVGSYDESSGRFDNFEFWNLDGVEF